MNGDLKCKACTLRKLVALHPNFVVIAGTHAIEAIDLNVDRGGVVVDPDVYDRFATPGADGLSLRDNRRTVLSAGELGPAAPASATNAKSDDKNN